MKRYTNQKVNRRWAYLAGLVGVSALNLTLGCGSAQPTAPDAPPVAPPVAVVPPVPVSPGQVQPVAPVVPGCLALQPQTPIPFSGTQIYMDSVNLVGGLIPPVVPYFGGQTHGSITLGGSVTQGPFQDDPRSMDDGMINMNVIPSNPNGSVGNTMPMGGTMAGQPGCIAGYAGCSFAPGYNQGASYGQNTANINGTFSISTQAYQDILYKIQLGQIPGSTVAGPVPAGYANQPIPVTQNAICLTGIAIDLGYKQTTLYGGYIFLYLNQSTHGYILHF